MSLYNNVTLKNAIATTLVNYPAIQPSRIMCLLAYLGKMTAYNRREKPAAGLSNEQLLQSDLQTALKINTDVYRPILA